MSTKSSLSYNCPKGNHKLQWHSFKDLHQPDGTIVFEFWCNTCNCNYTVLIDEHLGKQLSDILKQHEEK